MMATKSCMGKVQTVTGLMNPNSLGVTLTHEHLWIDAGDFFIAPESKNKGKINAPLSLPNFGWILQNPYSHKPNLIYGKDEKDTITEEMNFFKENGGCTVVDNTTIGLDPNVEFLKDISQQTGVNIVAGAGYYVASFQTESVKAMSVESMCEQIRHDIVEGVGDSGIKCGVIGEVGCAWPLEPFEKKSLQAAGIVQSELGTPAIIHPGRNAEAPFDIMRIFLEAGGKADQVVMSHLDRTILDTERLLDFADMGCYCEYDLFGIEKSHYQCVPSIDMPSDAQRIQMVKSLLDNGFKDYVLLSQDIHTKHRLTKFGGHGFSHLLVNIVPKMLNRGISQEDIDKMLIHNPKKWLTYDV